MTYWIDIRCRNSGHEGREAKIRSFMRMDDPEDTWQPELFTKHNPKERSLHAAFDLREDSTVVTLIAEQLAKEHEDNPYRPLRVLPSYRKPGMMRSRFSLPCKLCGLKVDVRPENLYRVLDQIIAVLSTTREFHGGGVVRLELVQLAGILSRARRRA